jgi:dephospho-CoA kinase
VRIAITGGIATGKSTILAEWSRHGIEVGDADRVVADLWMDAGVLSEVQAAALALGESASSKAEARALLSKSPEFRAALNRVFHPRVVAHIESSPIVVWEVPLLIETCWLSSFGRVLLVYAPRRLAKERLSQRVEDPALAEKLLSTQLPISAKSAFADAIVRTDRRLDAVLEEARGIGSAWLDEWRHD